MRVSTFRRLAAPLVAGVAAVGLIVAGSGTAMAADPPPAWSGYKTPTISGGNLSLSAVKRCGGRPHPGRCQRRLPGRHRDLHTAKDLEEQRNKPVHHHDPTDRAAGFQYQSNTVSKQSTVTNEGAAGVKATCFRRRLQFRAGPRQQGLPRQRGLRCHLQDPRHQAAGDYNAGFLFDVYSFSTGQGTNPAGAWVRCRRPGPHDHDGARPRGPRATGEPVTLTATVDRHADCQVQFKDGTSNIGSPVTPVNGCREPYTHLPTQQARTPSPLSSPPR